METIAKNKKILGIGIIALCIVIIGAAYVLKNGPGQGNGVIELTNTEGGTIYIDNKAQSKITGAGSTRTIKGLSPGNHTVLVAKDNHWPWMKNMFITASSTENAPIELASFNILRTPQT